VGEIMVTGATGGIGQAVVAALIAAGNRVTAVGRDLDRLPPVAGLQTVTVDLAQPRQLAQAVGDREQLDALVYCAGVSIDAIAPIAGTRLAAWQETMAVNTLAAAELTRVVLPALRRSQGHVVFINSSRGVRAVPGWSAFAASKAALQELADSLRAEETGNGVRVTTIYPEGTATEHLRQVRAAFGRGYDPQQCIKPETLAAMVAWVLDSPADAYASELAVVAAPRGG
jgi:NADP-dependent 3-hydroxy acid dehydrogenase YdfG